jgi:hypothetical protein
VRLYLSASLWLLLAVSVNLSAQAQKPAFSDPTGPPFLVRLQRITSDRDVCALVRGDGFFHVEREMSNHFVGLEGVLDESELVSLRAALNNRDLAALSQRQVTVPLVISERDELRISILRSPLTQNLTFLDSESRRPYDDFIRPLLRWIDILQKHSHTPLDEYSGRNNCLPPRSLSFSPRRLEKIDAGPAATGSTSAPLGLPPTAPFVIRWQFEQVAAGATKSTCIVVSPSGRFRMEKTSQEYREKLRVNTYEDSLNQGELEQLKLLLEDPRVKDSSHQSVRSGKVFREEELTILAVNRGDHIQQLSFADYFGVPGWVSNVNSSADSEERIVKPLRKWLKSHVEEKKMVAVSGGMATHCVVAPQ